MFAVNTTLYIKALGGFLFVLSLLAAFACGLRWVKNRGYLPLYSPQTSRLKILETLKISPNRQLVLIQNDSLTHLILIGPPDLLIHTINPADKGPN